MRRGSATALIVTAIAVVDEQQDHDDEQQPTAVSITTKQVLQTHTQILLSPLFFWSSATAPTTAVTASIGIGVLTATAILIKNQNDRNDEQQPSAVDIAAEQITQTHTHIPLSESRVALSFSYYVDKIDW